MSYPQPNTRTALIPPITVKYAIVWQETPSGHPKPGDGNIIITVTDITIIPDAFTPPTPQYLAVAKLTWGVWEANFGCTYHAVSSIFLNFVCLRMNDAMSKDVRGRGLDGDGKGKERWDQAELKICTAAVDDHNSWMLRVEVGGNSTTTDVSYSAQPLSVKLWGKRVVGHEGVKLSRAEKDRLQIDPVKSA